MILTPGDVDIGFRTVWMEARGEPREGKVAVAQVLFNRRDFRPRDRWATIAQVCLDWLQFSGWREQDPNFLRAQELTLNTPSARTCLQAFLQAWDERARGVDGTLGSRHYFNPAVVSPPWARGKTPVLEVGRHAFYNDIA